MPWCGARQVEVEVHARGGMAVKPSADAAGNTDCELQWGELEQSIECQMPIWSDSERFGMRIKARSDFF